MAAPAVTARIAPVGVRLDDGHSTVIAFANAPGLILWEKQVKPPGIDGGDAIDTTTMHNVTWRTRSPRQLQTLTDSSFVAAYDPDVIDDIISQVNVPQAITVHRPDGDTDSFFGYLKSADFSDLREGEQPEVTCTIVPTNYDPVNCVEAGPVHVSGPGTCGYHAPVT